jgi:uncharacterized PurR-regulated membrane protein YhhQ (DUF165 family)
MRNYVIVPAAAAAFVFTIWLANWLVSEYGPIRAWPSHWQAPAGVYVVGLAFLLRDVLQRLAGVGFTLACVAVGVLLSYADVSHSLAWASAAAFAVSEVVGLAVFWGLGGQRGDVQKTAGAVATSSFVAACLDSYVFLSIAFHSLDFFEGQVFAKLSVTAVFFPLVLLVRRAVPTPLGVAQHAAAAGEPVKVTLT